MGKLNKRYCEKITAPGRYGDGDTLYLLVKDGRKSWVQRVYVKTAGKVQDIGLGPFPLVDIAEARNAAFENRRAVRAGADLLAAKHQDAKVPTFRQAADATRKTLIPGWKSDQSATKWDGILAARVFPAIGNKRVDSVTREDVLRILEPIWTEKPALASDARQHMRQTFSWCLSKGFVDVNVVDVVSGCSRRSAAR